jgi:hypothetical protein
MGEFKSLKEITGDRRFAFLGGRTMRENFEHRNAKWVRGEGVLAPEPKGSTTPYAWWGPRYAGHWPADWKQGDPIPKARPVVETPRDLAAELETHLTRVGVPIRLANVLRSGLEEREAVRKVREWYASDKSLLLLHGETGVGKSCAAASLFLLTKKPSWVDGQPEWNSRGAFADAQDVASNLFTDEGKAVLAFLEGAEFVVLDELGVETVSAPWLSALDNLLNKRFGNPRLRTVLATNISAARASVDKPSPFETRYGSRIARRIRESGMVFAASKMQLPAQTALEVSP